MRTSRTESLFWPPKGGRGWLDSRSQLASKVVVLFGRWSQFRSRHMCLPELESEDLSNRIVVLELESEDLSSRIVVLASLGESGVAGLAESVRIKSCGSVRKGDTKGGHRSVPPKSL